MIYYQFRAISSENQCLGYACSPHAEMPSLQFYRNRVLVYIVCLVYYFFYLLILGFFFLFRYLFSILLNKLFSFLFFFLGFITYPALQALYGCCANNSSCLLDEATVLSSAPSNTLAVSNLLCLPLSRFSSRLVAAKKNSLPLALQRKCCSSQRNRPEDPDYSLSCVSLGFECVVQLGIDTVCAQEYPPPHCRVCTFLYHGASDQKVNLYRRRGGVQEKVSPGLLRPVTVAEDV